MRRQFIRRSPQAVAAANEQNLDAWVDERDEGQALSRDVLDGLGLPEEGGARQEQYGALELGFIYKEAAPRVATRHRFVPAHPRGRRAQSPAAQRL